MTLPLNRSHILRGHKELVNILLIGAYVFVNHGYSRFDHDMLCWS